ncbi:MAG: methylated-DNA--[protein]-cysteine S-methyltransferase [Actinomycetota bacterium]
MTASGSSETLLSREISSPVGALQLVASECGLRAIDVRLGHAGGADDPETGAEMSPPAKSSILDEAERQLHEYFEGRRVVFEIPLDPVGTEFQLAAWRILSTIPYGTTISYADQARALGDVRKARAVGGANGRNPIPIIVPCHRVIGSDGSLTGFALGTDMKKSLLDFERRHQ